MSYWEHEISDKDFELFTLYIKRQKELGKTQKMSMKA